MGAEEDHIRNLRCLLDVTRSMAGTTDLDDLLGTIVDATCAVLRCERATVFLYAPQTNELFSRVATGTDSIRFPADRGIAGAAAAQRRVINVPDAYADDRFNREIDRKTGYRTRNLLTFPLENLEGDLVGVLQALNHRNGTFTHKDEELAEVLRAQAGVALHRHRLLEEQTEKQRMQRDLDIAREIQQNLFPKQNPHVPGYEIAGWNRSADETGGDCYDFMELPDGRLALMLADATGHGIGAALVIAQCRSLTRAMLSFSDDLAAVATRVNQILSHDLADDRFVTALIGILDPRHHRLNYVAPGQGPLLYICGPKTETRTATGLPFAIVDDLHCDTDSFAMQPGTTVALLTDGFFETASPDGELYGEARVAEFVAQHASQPLDQLVEALHAELQRFSDHSPQADDLTAVLVRRPA